MSPSPRARTGLLTLLLDAYERSSCYASPAPWRRDVIVKLDAGTFPEAFAPDGRERHVELMAAAADLEREGALRIVRHARGPLSGEPRELRLGPAEVNPAYGAAVSVYEPLALGLGRLERHARNFFSHAAARPFLKKLAAALPAGDLSAIGMGRSRFKQEWRMLIPALTAAVALLDGVTPSWERMISERLFRDSKLLGRVRHHVIAFLLRMDPQWDGVPPDEAEDLLEAYGVRRKPGLIRCAGSGALHVGAREYRLEDFTPVAHLPDTWSDAWVQALAHSGVRCVTTIENEFPFLSYVEEAGGPGSLGARGEIAVYTAGFPTPALTSALADLKARIGEAEFRHWGDADVGGLRIWWFLRCRLNRPVSLFRTTAQWVETERVRGGRRLSTAEVEALQRLKLQLEAVTGDDVRAASELIDKLIEVQIRIEQERF